MVAQLAGNLRGYRLRQGVAGTSLLPGDAVYTTAKDAVSKSVQWPRVAVPHPRNLLSALNPGFPGHRSIAFGPKHNRIRLGLSFF